MLVQMCMMGHPQSWSLTGPVTEQSVLLRVRQPNMKYEMSFKCCLILPSPPLSLSLPITPTLSLSPSLTASLSLSLPLSLRLSRSLSVSVQTCPSVLVGGGCSVACWDMAVRHPLESWWGVGWTGGAVDFPLRSEILTIFTCHRSSKYGVSKKVSELHEV